MEFVNRLEYKNKTGIYAIKNLVNGNLYIGQTMRSFQKRYWHHQWKLRNNQHDNIHLQNAWNLYGEENFIFDIVELCDDKTIIDNREKFWISHYKSLGICYSIQSGGKPTDIYTSVTEESLRKLAEANRKRMTGTKLSESTKRKMSESRTGKHVNKKTDLINEDIAREIKEMLVSGHNTKDIISTLNIPYRCVNNILSNDSFAMVKVDGWDEFQKTRKRQLRLTKEEIDEIYKLYDEIGTYRGVARIIGRDKEVVKKHILKRTNNKTIPCQASNEEGVTTIREE